MKITLAERISSSYNNDVTAGSIYYILFKSGNSIITGSIVLSCVDNFGDVYRMDIENCKITEVT